MGTVFDLVTNESVQNGNFVRPFLEWGCSRTKMENFWSGTHFLNIRFYVVTWFGCQDDSSKGMCLSARAGLVNASASKNSTVVRAAPTARLFFLIFNQSDHCSLTFPLPCRRLCFSSLLLLFSLVFIVIGGRISSSELHNVSSLLVFFTSLSLEQKVSIKSTWLHCVSCLF